MRVVVLDVLAQYDVEMAWPDDQEVVEAFPAQGADEAFRDSVRPRCPHRRADDADIGTGEDSDLRNWLRACALIWPFVIELFP